MSIHIYETTLREGMQTPGGIGCNDNERIAIAHYLAPYADWLEIGMPANEVDFKSIAKIRDSFNETNKSTGLAVLCRLHEHDIMRAQEVLQDYKHTMAHLFIGVSEEHQKHRGKTQRSTNDYNKLVTDMIEYAATSEEFERIMFSPEDGIRAFHQNPDGTKRIIESAIKGYQKSDRAEPLIINPADTTGGRTVSEFMDILRDIKSTFGKAIELSTHSHNDTQMANAHSLEGAISGIAPWIQTTISSLGERNGIAQTENVIAVLHQRGLIADKTYSRAEILNQLVPTVKTVNAILGRTIPDESAVSGSRTNISTSGIHTDIAGKDENTYHIYGSTYGATTKLEFGPVSGVNQVIPVLAKIGMHYKKSDLVDFVNELKQRANAEKRTFSDSDIWHKAICDFAIVDNVLEIDDYQITTSRSGDSSIHIKGAYQNKSFNHSTNSPGPIEGLVHCLSEVCDTPVVLKQYETMAIPKIDIGEIDYTKPLPMLFELAVESQLKAYCEIENENITYTGYARERNSFNAGADAIIDAFVKMETIRSYMNKKKVDENNVLITYKR